VLSADKQTSVLALISLNNFHTKKIILKKVPRMNFLLLFFSSSINNILHEKKGKGEKACVKNLFSKIENIPLASRKKSDIKRGRCLLSRHTLIY